MALAIVASSVERDIILGKVLLGRFWALIFPSDRFAGDVRPLESHALVGESKYCRYARRPAMRNKIFIILGVLVVMGAIAGGIVYANLDTAIKLAGMAVNYIKYLNAPAGTTVTELAPGYKGAALALSPAAEPRLPNSGAEDWPSYNRTLTSERFSQISQINTSNVNTLKVLCTYDTGQYTGFNSGLIKVNDALIFTTQFDIFSIDPATCQQTWRTHEDYKPATPQPVSRGAVYMDGLLFRGSGDGRVLAYDVKTGKRVWETSVADAKRGETTPSAPIAWDGLVFIGNAGSDIKGGKGRMYALEAKTGKIVWEFYMVPKTEGEVARGPIGQSPLDMSTWKNAPEITDHGRRNVDVLHVGSRDGPPLCTRGQSRARFRDRRPRGRQSIYRFGSRAGRQNRGLQKPFQARAD